MITIPAPPYVPGHALLQGKSVLITAAAGGGIGFATARRCLEEGCRGLVISDIHPRRLDEAVAALRKDHPQQAIHGKLANVAVESEVQALVEEAEQQLGCVDVLLNNAGLESACRYDLADPAGIQQMIAVNLTGPMLLSRLLLPGMIARGRGHIVNIASVAGLMATPYEETYNASKFGLVGFSRALRLTAEDNGWPVGVSVICPGFMAGTGMYHDMQQGHGVSAPAMLGTVDAEQMGPALIRAIENNLPDVVLMKGAPRLSAALGVLAPRLYAWIMHTFKLAAPFKVVAQSKTSA